MPTNRKRKKRNACALDDQHIDQFIIGWPMLAGTGFSKGIGNGGAAHWAEEDWRAFRAAMRDGWEQHGAAFMAWWRGETEQFTATCLTADPRDLSKTPWALAEFGEPE